MMAMMTTMSHALSTRTATSIIVVVMMVVMTTTTMTMTMKVDHSEYRSKYTKKCKGP